MTNLECIRRMTTEQLAAFLSEFVSCRVCEDNENKDAVFPCCPGRDCCVDGLVKWLEMEHRAGASRRVESRKGVYSRVGDDFR